MKLGTENKVQTGLAIALMVIALLLVIRMIAGLSSTAEPVASAASATTSPRVVPPLRAGTNKKGAPASRTSSLDPRLHVDLLNKAEAVEYSGKGRDIFSLEPEIPKPVQSPIVEKTPPPEPQGPPPPPPIPLKFYGWASRPGQPKRIFFTDNGDVVGPAGEGDVVERRYRIIRINQASVEVEDVLSNSRQTIPLDTSAS